MTSVSVSDGVFFAKNRVRGDLYVSTLEWKKIRSCFRFGLVLDRFA
jgi:hypothetical protein